LLQVSAHKSPQGVLLEFESPPASPHETLQALYPRLRGFVEGLGQCADIQTLAQLAVRQLRSLTGFNRVMLYSFDAEGSGKVLAEDRDAALPSYCDLRFPATDIPAQARDLYRLNRIRMIPNANYDPIPVLPARSPLDGETLDLSLAALRSVSPVHLEYMRNMGTLSSMSISILVDGALWGLVSCHHAEPRGLNAELRNACDFLGQIVSLQIGERQRAARASRRIDLKQIQSEMLARISHAPSFQEGLAESGEAWLRLVDAQGAAVVTPERLAAYGRTPSQPELEELAGWLRRRGFGEVFATDSLSSHWPQASAFSGIASGLLAISISQLHPSYIMWFREEVVRTVKWAGDPGKAATESNERLHPRQSFALWKEHVHLRSLPWSDLEVENAGDFRNAIMNLVLRRAEERAALSEQLRITNQELEAFSYSISHDLRAPFRHIAGYGELLKSRLGEIDSQSAHYLDSILEATISAGQLVDDLLSFSQAGRASLSRTRVDVAKIIGEVRHSMAYDTAGQQIEWEVGELPPAIGDASMLRQAFSNIVENAVKYSRGRNPAKIRITAEICEGEIVYQVSDNGVGFDMAYVGKLFGVFQRLHRADEFPGTGIGLALTKRIIDRHGGRVFARGEIGEGATIGFALPQPPEERKLA
jgi:chemotaxis family two-component system sensor kinase Cph1